MTPTPAVFQDYVKPIALMCLVANAASSYSQPVSKEIDIQDLTIKIGAQTRRSSEQSIFLGGALAELRSLAYELYSTRNKEGWDGYDALPITEQSKETALAVIDLLPSGTQKPELIPLSSGGYGLEWDTEGKTYSLLIENNELIWSYIEYGTAIKRKRSGLEKVFANALPSDVLTILKEKFRAA